MRVSSPQVLATLMPPPLGMWRSHTTRSGLVRADHLDRLVGVAGLADDVEVAAEVGAHAGPPDRVVVGEDDAHHLQVSHGRDPPTPTAAPRCLGPGCRRPRRGRRPPPPGPGSTGVRPTPSAASGPKPRAVVLHRAEHAAVVVGLGVDGDRPAPAVLAGVGERLATPRRPGPRPRRSDRLGQVVGDDDLGPAVEVVLEPRRRLPQPRAERRRRPARRRRGTRAARAPGRGPGATRSGSVGAALDDGQRLEHAVVQRAGHLLAGLRGRDLPLGLAELHGGVAGRPRRRGRRARRSTLARDGQVSDRRRCPRSTRSPNSRPRPTTAPAMAPPPPAPRHPGGEHAGQRPHRAERLRVGAGERPSRRRRPARSRRPARRDDRPVVSSRSGSVRDEQPRRPR